jgi:hypothetical protein
MYTSPPVKRDNQTSQYGTTRIITAFAYRAIVREGALETVCPGVDFVINLSINYRLFCEVQVTYISSI